MGVIRCVNAIAPHFRANRAGVIIDVSSTGGLTALPAYTLYNATKFAFEALAEAIFEAANDPGDRLRHVVALKPLRPTISP